MEIVLSLKRAGRSCACYYVLLCKAVTEFYRASHVEDLWHSTVCLAQLPQEQRGGDVCVLPVVHHSHVLESTC